MNANTENNTRHTPDKTACKTSRILAGSVLALLAVHSARADTTVVNGQTLNVDPAAFFPGAGIVTLGSASGGTGPTLGLTQGGQSAPPGGITISNAFVLSGNASTVNLRFNNNDTKWVFAGPITSTATVNQTLAITTGSNGNGDREDIVFATAIPDATGGSKLGLDITYNTQSPSLGYVNLASGNTFTGNIATHQGNNAPTGYLVIGGERYSLAFNANLFNTQGASPSNGTLGTTAPGVGSYAGAISLDVGTILDYNSTGTQTLSGAITGNGSLLMTGTGILTLSGANNYSGGTSFQGNGDNGTGSSGTLKMGAVNALPTTGVVDMGTNSGALLDLDGFNTTIGSLTGGGAGGGNVSLGANGVLTVGNATSTTYGGLISGTGTAGLTKQGFSTLTLSSSGTHTYTGPTNVTQGTLALTGNLSSSAVTVNGFAKLAISTAAAHSLGTNLNFANNSTLQVECAGLAVGSVSVTGNLDVLDNPTLKLASTGSFTAAPGAYTVIGAGALTANQAAWTLDASVINDNAPDKTSHWKDNPVTDVFWDTAANWSQQLYGGTVAYVGTNLQLNLTKYNTAPVATTQVTIAPTNAIAVTGPASPTTMASLTLGTSSGPVHSLTTQSGGTLTVNGTVTLNPTGSLTAASGNELVVKGKFASGTVTITAGATPFKIGGTNMTAGTNVVNNLGKLIIEGGTTKVVNAAISTISLTDSGSAWGGGATNPVSNNFTVSPGANVLIVNIASRQAVVNGSYIGGPAPVVTYGGTPLTLATFGESDTQNYVDAWVYYMYNPTTGSSLPLSTTFTSPNANSDYAVSALTLGGVNTATAPKTGNSFSDSDNVSVTVNNIALNSWLNSVAAVRTTGAMINQTVTSGTYGSLLNTGAGGGGNAFWLQNANGDNMSAGGMLMTGITSSSVTLNSQVGGSFRWGAAAAAFAPTATLFAINQPTTTVDVTGANTLDLGAAPAVTLGTLTLHDSSSLTLTNTPAPSVSFSNIVANGTSQIASGVPLELRTPSPSITVNAGSLGISAALILDAGTTITTAGGSSVTLSGGVTTPLTSGNVSVVKNGPGTLTLTASNTYTGATTINAGTLALGATGAIHNSSGISVAGGATYDVSAVSGYVMAGSQTLSAPGTGIATVNGSVNAGANTISLQDGTNIGTLAFNNNLTLNGSTLKFDLGPGNAADRITIAGTPNLSGTNTINVAALTGLTSLATGNYTLITAGGGLNTTFSLASSTLTVGGNSYSLSLGNSTGLAEILTVTSNIVNGTWTNVGGNRLWSNTANWTPNSVPDHSGATANFTQSGLGATSAAVQLGSPRTVGTLVLNATSGGYTIGTAADVTTGNVLVLNNGANPAAVSVTSGTHTIAAPVELDSDTRVSVGSNSRVTTTGTITQGNGTHSLSISSTDGSGTVDLNGSQFYDSLTIGNGTNAGTVNINGAVGTDTANGSANVTVEANAILNFGSVSQTLASLSIGDGAVVTFDSGFVAFSDPGAGANLASFGGVAVVPEPGTFSLLLVGSLGFRKRRRRPRR